MSQHGGGNAWCCPRWLSVPPTATVSLKDLLHLVLQQTIFPTNCKVRELEARSMTKNMKGITGDTDGEPKQCFQVMFYFFYPIHNKETKGEVLLLGRHRRKTLHELQVSAQ